MPAQPIPPDDAFLGTWVLQPAQSQYAFGQPPKTGTYQVSALGHQYRMDIHWTDASDNPFETAYQSTPDGVVYPFEGSPAVDAVCTTRVDERTLDSVSYKGDVEVAHARRVLSEDGQSMTVTQSGITPQGNTFHNISVYKKQ